MPQLKMLSPQRPYGIFGSAAPRRTLPDIVRQTAPPALPGPVSGFGGGTFNLDGSQATPVQGPPSFPPVQQGEAPRTTPQSPLGGSLRQPFDYDAAFAAMAGDQRKPKRSQRIAAIAADFFAGAAGRPGFATQALRSRQDAQQGRLVDALTQLQEWKYRDWARQNEADLGAAAPFTVGRDRLSYDPATGKTRTIYDGPEDFELYASELGLQPGTQEYFDAVEDYVLRSSGPSAYDRDVALDDHRTGNDERLEGLRHRNRTSLEGMRQSGRLTLRQTPAAPRSTGGRGGAGGTEMPTFATPQEAKASGLPSGTPFRTRDGRVLKMP